MKPIEMLKQGKIKQHILIDKGCRIHHGTEEDEERRAFRDFLTTKNAMIIMRM